VSYNCSANTSKKPYGEVGSDTVPALLELLYYSYPKKMVLFAFALITGVLTMSLLRIVARSH
jgi:hypothetical protein